MKFLILIILLLFASCSVDNGASLEDCGSSYELYETYFAETDTLKFQLKIIYMSADSLSKSKMEAGSRRIEHTLNKGFADAKIQFLVNFEPKNIVNERFSSAMDEFPGHSVLFSERRSLTVFVYPASTRATFAGMAAKIPSYSFCIKENYIYSDPNILTHEMGHVLGLYHTHQPDKSSDGFTTTTGDKVCDTPKSANLLGKINSDCEANSYMNVERVIIENHMSYVPDHCRKNFTEGQLRRIKWSIENSRDLISALR